MNQRGRIYKGAIAIAYLCMFFEGGSNMLLSATKTQLMQLFHINLFQISTLFTVRSVVCGLVPFFCGRLSDLYGRKKVIFAGCLLFLVYYIMVPSFVNFQAMISLTILIGLGYSFMDPSAQAVLFDSFDDATPMMPYVQVAFAGGSVLIPLAVSFLTDKGLGWKMSYYGYLIMTACLGAFVLLQKFPQLSSKVPDRPAAGVMQKSFLYDPKPMREGLTIFLSAVCNALVLAAVTNYADIYLQDVFLDSSASSVRVLSFYEFGCVVGAILVSKIAFRVHASELIFFFPVFSFAMFLTSLFMPSGTLFMIFVSLSGLSTGTMFSIAVSLSGQLFWRNSGAAVGAISSASAVGMALASSFVGGAIPLIGVHQCYFVISAVAALNVFVGYIVRRQYRKLTDKVHTSWY